MGIFTSTAPTYREAWLAYRRNFDERVAKGSLRPMVMPYHLYGLILLSAYLSIPHTKRPYVYKARWIVLAVICWFQWVTLFQCSSISMATSFGTGLISVYGIVASVVWLVWMKPQFDCKRVERRTSSRGHKTNGSAIPSREHASLRHRTTNGEAKGETNGELESSEETEYYWQHYPTDNLYDRVDWVLDLLMNFRGPGWNWAIPTLPGIPPYVKAGLGEAVDDASRKDASTVGVRRFLNRKELFMHQVPKFVVGYFALDFLKVIMMKDPYFFLGPNGYSLPPHLVGFSAVSVYLIRQVITLAAILTSLEMVFLLGPICFGLILGPSSFLGLRGEAWYYPTTFGSFSSVLAKGLGGLWGGWWHQLFRFIFQAPSTFLVAQGYMKPKSPLAAIVALLFAFGISGALHTGGSISQIAPTRPWHPTIFFLLQALGIFLQTTFCTVLRPQLHKVPKWLRQTGNLLFALVWGFSTCWWLTDDFARGGIWLWEPIPVSPLRGLGFGVAGDSWWCWEHLGIGWYTGQHWWESGLAF